MALSTRLSALLKNISKTTQKGEAIHELAAAVDAAGGGGAVSAHPASGLPASESVQEALQGLSARIKTLEDAAGG